MSERCWCPCDCGCGEEGFPLESDGLCKDCQTNNHETSPVKEMNEWLIKLHEECITALRKRNEELAEENKVSKV